MKNTKWLIKLIILGGILFSCSDETFDDFEKTTVNDEFLISKTIAENIANDLFLVDTEGNSSDKVSKRSTLKNQKKNEIYS